MKIKILPSAIADLDRGRIFYSRQGKSVGDYFLDSLFSDIESPQVLALRHDTVLSRNGTYSTRCHSSR